MSGGITVAVRVRPLNETEISNRDECIWSIDPLTPNTIGLTPTCLYGFMEEGKLSGLAGTEFRFRSLFNEYRKLYGWVSIKFDGV